MGTNKTALITGASEGIGKEMAFKLAEQGYNLILVALEGLNLDTTSIEVSQKTGKAAHPLGLDLTKEGNVQKIKDFCQQNKISISILINNAGMGSVGPLEKFDSDFYGKMISLNITPMVQLVREFAEDLKKNKGHVVNISSLASYNPIPYKAVYAATKTFVYSFSRAIREEFKPENVGVTVVCPGGVITNERVREAINKGGFFARISAISPQQVTEDIWDGIVKNKAVVIPGKWNKFFFSLSSLFPATLKPPIIAKIFRKRG
ncbi:MAG: short-subunit dehydrogenase [Sphingobacteriales bacterium]|jgi:short-subunit dehydrogenase